MPSNARRQAEKLWDAYEAADAARDRLRLRMRRLSLANQRFVAAISIGALSVCLVVGWSALIWAVLCFVTLIAVTNRITIRHFSSIDAEHTAQAGAMRSAVHEILDIDPEFLADDCVLWLRPFYTDISIGFISERSRLAWLQDWIPITFWSANIFFDINDGISDTVGQWKPVVALGEPEHIEEDQLVCYQAVSDETWQEVATRFIRLAKAIIFMPDATEGALWELQEIQRLGRLEHTVFLMPGENRFAFEDIKEGGRKAFNPRTEWQLARVHLQPHGFHLPEFDARGFAFTLHETMGELRADRIWFMHKEAETVDEMQDNFAVLLEALVDILDDGPEWTVL